MRQPVAWMGLALLFFCWNCNSGSPDVPDEPSLFTTLPADQTHIDFSNQLNENEAFNIIKYLYFYNGGGVAIGDINNDGFDDIYFTANQQSNRLYLNKGNFEFEDITENAGVGGVGDWSTGVTMADVNADGWLDIYVCQAAGHEGLRGRNQLFINQQNGRFIEAAAEYGLDFKGLSTQAAFFDYDADGDLDVYLLNHSVHSSDNYGQASQRLLRDELAGDRLYRNDDGFFYNVTEEAGIFSSKIGYGLGLAIGDLNNDNCPDIYVSNDFHENDYLYYNNCDGTFTEGLTASMGHTSTFSMGNDLADFNNDGRLDMLTLDMKPEDEKILKRSLGPDPYNIYKYKLGFGYYYQYPRNMLHLNQGSLMGGKAVQFSEIGQLAGVAETDWSWSPLICDFDNDGWKDLFISNGIWRRPNDLDYLNYASNQQIQQSASDLKMASKMPSGKVPNYFFKNEKNLQFRNVSFEWGMRLPTCSNGSAIADLDNDGDYDLIINNLNEKAGVFRNESKGNHFLKVRLRTDGQNTFGIGARISVFLDSTKILQEIYTTRSFLSASSPTLVLGLGRVTNIDSVEVRWPDGTVDVLENVELDQLMEIKQSGIPQAEAEEPASERLFNNISVASRLNFHHRENRFVDFDREKLMPHMLSTQGPGLAVGDVNQDGLEDVYVGGATNQAGALFFQTEKKDFQLQQVSAFDLDRVHEDVDATFFDANGDGYLDLYVVSGGGEWTEKVKVLQDRLYINDGTGSFSKSEKALPDFYSDGACVQAFDYNADGALDLFIGSRFVPGQYGLTPPSFLLENDGQGNFKDISFLLPQSGALGMVTDAASLKDNELVIVGEWMPVTFLEFANGECTKSEIPYSNGWWNCVYPSDLDGDGELDLVLGNLGKNADLKASKTEPVELFVGDFDDNGSSDPILTYYNQGQQYCYNNLNDLFMQLIYLRKEFPTYESFSEVTFKKVFESAAIKKAVHKTAYTFASSLAIKHDGAYVLEELPIAAQMAPVFAVTTNDFDQNGGIDILAVGNWFEVQPGLGRYDASYGCFISKKQDGSFVAHPPLETGFVVPGQSRAIQVIDQDTGTPLILVARNNERMLVFDVNSRSQLVN